MCRQIRGGQRPVYNAQHCALHAKSGADPVLRGEGGRGPAGRTRETGQALEHGGVIVDEENGGRPKPRAEHPPGPPTGSEPSPPIALLSVPSAPTRYLHLWTGCTRYCGWGCFRSSKKAVHRGPFRSRARSVGRTPVRRVCNLRPEHEGVEVDAVRLIRDLAPSGQFQREGVRTRGKGKGA